MKQKQSASGIERVWPTATAPDTGMIDADAPHPLTPEQQARFNKASEHPYECRCDLCKEWWANVPPEE
jgi:hypothetical protein